MSQEKVELVSPAPRRRKWMPLDEIGLRPLEFGLEVLAQEIPIMAVALTATRAASSQSLCRRRRCLLVGLADSQMSSSTGSTPGRSRAARAPRTSKRTTGLEPATFGLGSAISLSGGSRLVGVFPARRRFLR